MSKLCLVLGDQLSLDMSSIQSIDKQKDRILMAEVKQEATYVKHHKKKIAFIFSAMRHFAQQLDANGYQVDYIKYDDAENAGSLLEQVKKACRQHDISEVTVAQPGEYRLLEDIKQWEEELNIPVKITPDNRFMAEQSFFHDWAEGRKQLRMEYFYREMRKKHNYLMESGQPTGGKWNYDNQNREKAPKNLDIPSPTVFERDDITNEVIALVKDSFSEHFGDLDDFHYAVTRKQALVVLEEFIEHRLPKFGQYQDAMIEGEPWMYHSHVSFYINTGLLSPQECMDAAEQAYASGQAPLNSVEGFIRQILGWREYVRGFYWYLMPDYKEKNYLSASRALPDLYWGAETKMNCLKQCVKETKENAYAHHIQRLMVLGNFALLAGLDPDQVNEWYLIVYADAYEWVELPNVSGMILFTDGGLLASKPYAASGAYINKMSDYCRNCEYSVKEKTGHQACPFNYLYWDFLIRHQDVLGKNPRMGMIYNTLKKMDETKVSHMQQDAEAFFEKLANNEKV
ncbi:cryptochrome/photolyase family protein [Glaciecola sp. XM2]|jgi:deoxyribodipyrimidine photolyase-related protein|uniref:cryptochrome/photolyase family protein n=1 Tax=Glaciecola sp. XM2 TaxID=1914931 RepID=UPI001BDF2DF1|nr:cryptochrome/photolyase family protein [Glaciecola sp. XM2]MBT1449666.1 cryptochrome/photolyase family protein [Glaciecola sp. XM2]